MSTDGTQRGANEGGDAVLARQPLTPLHADATARFHDEATLDRLIEAAFSVLERTGARFESPRALAILREHGALVDDESGLVRFPPDLLETALARAPRTYVLGARDDALALDLASGATYCGPDGCGTEVVDWHTGERRLSTKADLAAVTRLHDYLGSLQFWWPSVGASDCAETAQLHELDAGWNNTAKHLQGMVNGEREARYAVEMARAVAGGAEALRRRPVMSNLVGVVTPLLHDRDATDAALVCAEAGIPMCFATTPSLGTTAPATKAGAYVLATAELVSAVALVQLAFPGAPVMGSITQIYADPRTAAVVTAPLDHRALPLATGLVHRLGLPALSSFGGTDAERPGSWQAGVETLFSLLIGALDGCELMTGIGLSDTYSLFTPENLMLDDDLYHRVRHAFLDIPVDGESLALDVIHAVGPGGHFLGQPHTRRHLRSAVVRAVTHECGPDGRCRDPREVARERGLDLLKRYRPAPLPDDLRRELSRIVAAADADLRG
jgi:trimethylamine--corrinoid protein Co-methyltransferase